MSWEIGGAEVRRSIEQDQREDAKDTGSSEGESDEQDGLETSSETLGAVHD
jgi:hypothetical protein